MFGQDSEVSVGDSPDFCSLCRLHAWSHYAAAVPVVLGGEEINWG